MWIDSHAHLFDYSLDECKKIVQDAADAEVGVILSTATDLTNAATVITQCTTFQSIWGAVGISPFDVINPPEQWYNDLTAYLSRPKIIAVGEIGIDSTNPRYPPLDLQLPMFKKQLACARDFDLPAIIHSRGAEQQAVTICTTMGIKKALFHCFTGSRESLSAIIKKGYHVSLSGIITFRNSDLRHYLYDIPLEQLHIETDSPYLAPVPHRGKKNIPAWTSFIGKEIARIFKKEDAVIQQQLEKNFRNFFGKFKPDCCH